MPLNQSFVLRALRDANATDRSVQVTAATPELPLPDSNGEEFPPSVIIRCWATPPRDDNRRAEIVFDALSQIKQGDVIAVQGTIKANEYFHVMSEDGKEIEAVGVDDIDEDELEELLDDNKAKRVTGLELYVMWLDGIVTRVEVGEGGGGGRKRRRSRRGGSGRTRGRASDDADDDDEDDGEDAEKKSAESTTRRRGVSRRNSGQDEKDAVESSGEADEETPLGEDEE